MFYQDLLEQSYLKLTTLEHRKNFAQFFTPPAIADLMASYILDNEECKSILDPAAGLSVFASAIDKNLKWQNELPHAHSCASFGLCDYQYSSNHCEPELLERAFTPNGHRRPQGVQYNHINYISLLAHNSDEAQRYFAKKLQGTATAPAPTTQALDLGLYTLSHRLQSFSYNADNSYQLTQGYACADTSLPYTGPTANTADAAATTSTVNTASSANTLGPVDESWHSLTLGKRQPHMRTVQLTAYELDPIITEFNRFFFTQHPLSFVNYDLRQKDYLKANFKERYDGIICNPPYLTFKEFAKKSQAITLIENRLGLELPGRINLYALFLLKSLSQLKSNGRCAYLIPYEFLNSSFGIKVKEQFLKQRNLAYVITFNIKGQIFDNATTTCGLFLFDNAKEQEHIEFITVHSLNELELLTHRLCPHLYKRAAPSSADNYFPGIVVSKPSQSTAAEAAAKAAHAANNAADEEAETDDVELDESLPLFAQATAATTTNANEATANANANATGTSASVISKEFFDSIKAAPVLINTVSYLEVELAAKDTEESTKTTETTNTSDTTDTCCKCESWLCADGSGYRPRVTISGEWQQLVENAISHHLAGKYLGFNTDLEQVQGRLVSYHKLNAKQKWHIYYQDRNIMGKLRDHKVGSIDKLSTFDKFIKVKRGLATGANDFFLFNQSKIAELKLKNEFFVPVIPRANLVTTPIFTHADFDKLAAANASVFLLNAPDEVTDKELKKYLDFGESLDIHRRYLTRHRCPWYALERREVAPILMSVFNRGSINVVRNEAQIYNLTTFHSIFVLDQSKTDLIFAYLLTPIAKDIILQNRREYGGGLEKLEPLDINHAACVNFNTLTEDETANIMSLYAQYRELILHKGSHSNGEAQKLIAAISQAFSTLL